MDVNNEFAVNRFTFPGSGGNDRAISDMRPQQNWSPPDSIVPPSSSGNSQAASLIDELQSLLSQLSSAISSDPGSSYGNGWGGGSQGAGPAGPSGASGGWGGNQNLGDFSNFTASDTGDPHLAFNGTTAGGSNVSDKYDNMSSDGNVISSNSFRGGYSVSSEVTQPNANGITLNKNVSVNVGNDTVTMNSDGSAQLQFGNGKTQTLQDGSSIHLRNGATVSDENGTVTVSDHNANGGWIQTALDANGYGGVDETTTGGNIALGGDTVRNALNAQS